MQYESLELLCCPVCKGTLFFEGEKNGELIRQGNLCCRKCAKFYPVETNIPRFVTRESLYGFNKRFERAYNRLSRFYDSAFTKAYLNRHFWPVSGEEKARKEVIERLEIYESSKILETSIGTGDNIPHLARCAHEIRIYGLDISQGMLAQCMRNLKKWKIEADLFLGNAEHLPFRDGSFDVVFHVGGINFFGEKRKAVEEMIRVARPGTKIVIACETEKAIESNRRGIRFVFGRQLEGSMLKFSSRDMQNLVPEDMLNISYEEIWEDNGYLLEFRKPCP